jgi:hypothetical protein
MAETFVAALRRLHWVRGGGGARKATREQLSYLWNQLTSRSLTRQTPVVGICLLFS